MYVMNVPMNPMRNITSLYEFGQLAYVATIHQVMVNVGWCDRLMSRAMMCNHDNLLFWVSIDLVSNTTFDVR